VDAISFLAGYWAWISASGTVYLLLAAVGVVGLAYRLKVKGQTTQQIEISPVAQGTELPAVPFELTLENIEDGEKGLVRVLAIRPVQLHKGEDRARSLTSQIPGDSKFTVKDPDPQKLEKEEED